MRRRSTSTTRLLRAALLVVILASACGTWRLAQGPAPQVLSEEQPYRVRLLVRPIGPMVVRRPAVAGDSLIGILERVADERVEERRVALPLTDIVQIEVEERQQGDFVDHAAQVGAVALGVTIAILVLTR